MKYAFAALVALAVLQAGWYYPRLPDIVATGWNAAGNPSRVASKPAFFAGYAGVLALLIASFIVLPRFLGRTPNEWWPLPNIDYWLAPERRAATLDRFAGEALVLGIPSLAFAVLAVEIRIRANLPGGLPFSHWPGILLTASCLIFLLLWARWLRGRWSRLPPGA